MKKSVLKTVLTKVIVSLLVVMMLVPSLASCSDTKDINDTIIPVYTFYGIKGEGTTDEAVRAVELSINRILMSRYTFAVDFRLFLEEEYEEALNAAIKEAEEYEEPDDESLASGELSPYDYTEDKIIQLLESGKDFELKAPRVDIVLCKDSTQYFDLANNKKLVAIDTTLTNEGKILSEYIHPTLFSLAKIGRKTFGVPNNTAMGQYEYIVFDKAYLEEHKYDYQTIKTLEDLEDYLKLIKDNHEDVIPLKKAGSPAKYEYLFGDDSPFYIEPTVSAEGTATGKIHGVFDSSLFAHIIKEYATLIGKYRSLGYIQDATSDKDYAVTFIKGTPSDIEALKQETGKDYEYVVYKTPTATTNSLDTIYSISSTVSTTEVSTLIDIIVALFTDEQIKNYFYYGIPGEHYIVDDDELVQPIKNSDTDKFEYNMKNQYTGNIYLAKQKQGESGTEYEHMKEINLATSMSLTSGFSYVPKTYTVGDKTLTEPNYVEIMSAALSEGFIKLSDGSYGYVNYDEYKVTVENELWQFARDSVKTSYVDGLVSAYLAKNAAYLKSEEFLSQLRDEATDLINTNLVITAKSALKVEFTSIVKEEMPNATAAEIDAAVQARITDEAIDDFISKNYTESDINKLIDNRMNILLSNVEADVTKDYMESSEFNKLVNKFVASEEYKNSVENYVTSQGDNYVEKQFIKKIEEQIIENADQLQKNAIDAVTNAIEEFNDLAITTFGWSDEDASTNLDVNTYEDFIEKRLEAQYYDVYDTPDPSIL